MVFLRLLASVLKPVAGLLQFVLVASADAAKTAVQAGKRPEVLKWLAVLALAAFLAAVASAQRG